MSLRTVLVAAALLLTTRAALANEWPTQRRFHGKVRVVSSAAGPTQPGARDVDVVVTLERVGTRRIRMVTQAAGAKVEQLGTIRREATMTDGERLDVAFDGLELQAAAEAALNAGWRRVAGGKLPVASATGAATLTIIGDTLTMQTTQTIERGRVAGLRGVALDTLIPGRITNGAYGSLVEE